MTYSNAALPCTRLLLASAAGACVLLPSLAHAQPERHTLSGSDVAIYNPAGVVRIERGSGADVVVEITRGGRDAAQLRVVTGEARGRNALRIRYPDNDDIVYLGDSDRGNHSTELRMDRDGTWGNRWNRGDDGMSRVRVKTGGRGTEAWTDMTVRVPAGKKVSVHNAVGGITATGVEADLTLGVSAARVSVTDTRGALQVSSGSGSVTVRGSTGSHLNIDNGSGGVSIYDADGGVCNVDTGSGGVRVDGLRCSSLDTDVGSGGVRMARVRATDVTVDAGSGTVSLDLLTSPNRMKVSTGSGGVSLTLPASLGATVDVHTGSGSITTDFPVQTTRVERRRLQGTIGDGSSAIRVDSGSGSVRLHRGRE